MKRKALIFASGPALLLLLNLALSIQVYGQDSIKVSDQHITQQDIGDVIRLALKKPPKIKPVSVGSLILLPIIGSNPATGFMIGIGGQYAFKVPGTTKYSALMGSAQFTSKSQVLFLLKNNIFTKDNRFFLSGDWRFQVFSGHIRTWYQLP